jgi:hypothetical protein
VPDPVEGDGLLLAPVGRLSKVQAASVEAAFAPHIETARIDAIQAIFLIFI